MPGRVTPTGVATRDCENVIYFRPMTVGLLTFVAFSMAFGGPASAAWRPSPSVVPAPIVSGLLGAIPRPNANAAVPVAATPTTPAIAAATAGAAAAAGGAAAAAAVATAAATAANAPATAVANAPPPPKPLPPEPPISPRSLHARVSPSVVALVVSGGKEPATVASGVLVTASGFVLTSRRAIGEAIDGAASVAMVRGGPRGRFSAHDLAQAVPTRLVAVSDDLDLALVEAMPAESVFYPHLPIARRPAADGAGVLAVGHAKKRGLWSATMIPIGPAMDLTGVARWQRKLPAESSLIAAGTPLVDAVGRIVGMVIEPTANGWRIAVDADGLMRFLLAAKAPELRFAGVPPFRRASPGAIVIGAGRPIGAKHADATGPLPGLVPAQATGTTAAVMPNVVKKSALDRRFSTAQLPPEPGQNFPPEPAQSPKLAQSTGADIVRRGPAGRNEVSFGANSVAISITLGDLDRHPVPATIRVETTDAPERGARNAPVTIVEFGDYHASETREAETTLRDLTDGPEAKSRWLWKDADRGDGADYHLPARAARAAGEQGAFWLMHDKLMRASPGMNVARVRKVAGDLELDPHAFASALSSDGLMSTLEGDEQRAGRVPLLSTPAFVVNGLAVDGGSIAGPAVRAAVDEELLAHAPKQAVGWARPPRTIASGAPVTGSSFDPAQMARVIAEVFARRVDPVAPR
jgi:protein-disulfide isomerase